MKGGVRTTSASAALKGGEFIVRGSSGKGKSGDSVRRGGRSFLDISWEERTGDLLGRREKRSLMPSSPEEGNVGYGEGGVRALSDNGAYQRREGNRRKVDTLGTKNEGGGEKSAS